METSNLLSINIAVFFSVQPYKKSFKFT